MIEREMEDLIAAYPDHFFPRHGFVLQGRQRSFHGVGRFDLLFVDRHGMNILMELKAVPPRYEVIDQVARYRDALEAQGQANVIMWIVAPVIPPGLRNFFSRLGIEYNEIHFSEFKRIADMTGYKLDQKVTSLKPNMSVSQTRDTYESDATFSKPSLVFVNRNQQTSGIDDWGFGLGTQPSYLLRELEIGGKTKEQLRSAFITHFYPDLTFAEGKSKSGFNVFFSDSKRPVATYHASRALLVIEDSQGHLQLDIERTKNVKAAIRGGILDRLRGVHLQREKQKFDQIQNEFGLPTELP